MAASLDPQLAYRYCWRLARRHPENFFVGSLFLSRAERNDIAAVYAYARLADDIADGDLPSGEKLAALDLWERRLDECLVGPSSHPAFVALGETIRQRGLPVEPLRALLRAFRYDAEFRPFATFDDLLGYCRCSANPVGRLVLAVFGYRDEALARLSDDVCTGLQLTNFWQDLSRDVPRGRCYVPLEDLARFGIGLDELLESAPGPGERRAGSLERRLRDCVRFEVERTRGLLESGDALASRVDRRVGREVRMFAAGGLRILDRVAAGGFAPFERRPRLTAIDKIRLLATGMGAARPSAARAR